MIGAVKRSLVWQCFFILLCGFSVCLAEEYGGVQFPQGAVSFADSVVSYAPGQGVAPPYNNPESALGAPDSFTVDNFVSLGEYGVLILRFTDNALTTGGDSGYDLWIFEVGADVEPVSVAISSNGTEWVDVGTTTGSSSGIDIDAYIGSGVVAGKKYFYVKLTDIYGTPSLSGTTSGADIDAVGAISSAPAISACPDSDGDGVPDEIDDCPNTPVGSWVNNKGCPTSGLYTQEQVNTIIANLRTGDMDGDGAVALQDAIYILQVMTGLRDSDWIYRSICETPFGPDGNVSIYFDLRLSDNAFSPFRYNSVSGGIKFVVELGFFGNAQERDQASDQIKKVEFINTTKGVTYRVHQPQKYFYTNTENYTAYMADYVVWLGNATNIVGEWQVIVTTTTGKYRGRFAITPEMLNRTAPQPVDISDIQEKPDGTFEVTFLATSADYYKVRGFDSGNVIWDRLIVRWPPYPPETPVTVTIPFAPDFVRIEARVNDQWLTSGGPYGVPCSEIFVQKTMGRACSDFKLPSQ